MSFFVDLTLSSDDDGAPPAPGERMATSALGVMACQHTARQLQIDTLCRSVRGARPQPGLPACKQTCEAAVRSRSPHIQQTARASTPPAPCAAARPSGRVPSPDSDVQIVDAGEARRQERGKQPAQGQGQQQALQGLGDEELVITGEAGLVSRGRSCMLAGQAHGSLVRRMAPVAWAPCSITDDSCEACVERAGVALLQAGRRQWRCRRPAARSADREQRRRMCPAGRAPRPAPHARPVRPARLRPRRRRLQRAALRAGVCG